jgi:signal transduction histidine kinase
MAIVLPSYRHDPKIWSKRIWTSVLFIALVWVSMNIYPEVSAYNEAPKKRVLVLHSYYRGYKWTDDESAGIEGVLKNVIGAGNLHIEYMDTKKVFGNLYSQRLYEVYKLKYKNFRFDAIITTDNNAFDFMRKYRDELFPGVPVIFCGVNYFQEADLKGLKSFTGVNEENDMRACIDLILKLHPETTKIVFINEWTTTGQRVHEAFVKVSRLFERSVQFQLLEDVRIEEILERLRSLPRDSVVLYTSFSRDKSGRLFEYNESVFLVTQNSRVPVYTTMEFNLGYGVVGGLIVTGYDQGEMAGRMALRILEGEEAGKVPVVIQSPKHYMFDYEQLKSFGISQAELPKESVIFNLPQTLYFKYKKWVDLLIVTFIILLLIISVLLVSIYRRKQTEKELKQSREKLRTLTWRLAEAGESERKAVSRELHDEIGQNLTILGLNLNLLRSLIPKESADLVHSRLADSLALVKQTTERTRNLMNNIRSPVLDDYGLVAAIELYGKQLAERAGLNIQVKGQEMDAHMPAHIENALFRVVQEALTNVVKHAKATQVIINVALQERQLHLSVEDNGIGYDMAETATAKEHGWGLITMSERALAVGGTCRVESRPGMGTHVIVEVSV